MLASLASLRTATPTRTPTSGALPTPPPLSLNGNPVFQAGASFGGNVVHGTGLSSGADDAALSAALANGDVLVGPGQYWINGTVMIPNNRHIQCPYPGDVTNGAVPTAYFVNTNQSQQMLKITGGTDNSIFYCGFHGPNFNIQARTVSSNYGAYFLGIYGGTGALIVGNDFNGIGGYLASIYWGPTASHSSVEYNHFQHCGYYGVQNSGGVNGSDSYQYIAFNKFDDCSGVNECDNGGLCGNDLFDSNHMTFTYGVGCRAVYGGGCYGFNGLSCGSGPAAGYSTEACSNNIIDGTCGSTIMLSDPGSYINNTCTGGCTRNNYGNAGC